MSSFLLVTEIHAFKVLPRPRTFALLGALISGGENSEGRTWVHWIVHQKWPVQCAHLMNLFLLVTEIHAFKVYLGLAASKGKIGWKWLKMTVSGSTRWKRLRGSDMAPLDSSWKWPAHCANLMSSFLLVMEIHAIKVLPRIYLDLEKSGEKWQFFCMA